MQSALHNDHCKSDEKDLCYGGVRETSCGSYVLAFQHKAECAVENSFGSKV